MDSTSLPPKVNEILDKFLNSDNPPLDELISSVLELEEFDLFMSICKQLFFVGDYEKLNSFIKQGVDKFGPEHVLVPIIKYNRINLLKSMSLSELPDKEYLSAMIYSLSKCKLDIFQYLFETDFKRRNDDQMYFDLLNKLLDFDRELFLKVLDLNKLPNSRKFIIGCAYYFKYDTFEILSGVISKINLNSCSECMRPFVEHNQLKLIDFILKKKNLDYDEINELLGKHASEKSPAGIYLKKYLKNKVYSEFF